MSLGSRNSPREGTGNPGARRASLWLRARMVQAIREFFQNSGYLEVETPQLIRAPAPEVHIDAVRVGSRYLHTSPELCMKRLLSAGYSEIFQITRCFREKERGSLHLSEFTLLEWYRAGIDYTDLMEECESLVVFVAFELGLGEKIVYKGQEIALGTPWERISVSGAFKRYAGRMLETVMKEGCFEEVMAEEIQPSLAEQGAVFLYDYPAPLAALARLKPEAPAFAERFELFLGGVEVANGFSELNDVGEQRLRFERESSKRRDMGKEVYPSPKRFLETLGTMPQAAGVALGVDRLAMVLADKARIDDVVAFTPEET